MSQLFKERKSESSLKESTSLHSNGYFTLNVYLLHESFLLPLFLQSTFIKPHSLD